MSIVIDTSALIAILQGERDAEVLAEVIESARYRLMSAASVVEASVVSLVRRKSALEVELFLDRAAVDIVPVTAAHVRIATEGFARFGKGRHAAGLNFGDCFSYALARATGYPLLFTGDDFARTDVTPARSATP